MSKSLMMRRGGYGSMGIYGAREMGRAPAGLLTRGPVVGKSAGKWSGEFEVFRVGESLCIVLKIMFLCSELVVYRRCRAVPAYPRVTGRIVIIPHGGGTPMFPCD